MVWFWVKCRKQGIKNQNSVFNMVGKSGSVYEGPGCTFPPKNIPCPHPPPPGERYTAKAKGSVQSRIEQPITGNFSKSY